MIGRVAMTAFAVLAYVGTLAHNLISLPQLALLSAENVAPLVAYTALAAAYWVWPRSRVVAALLVSWTLVNVIIGGVLTVLPVPFLPFQPEQTATHYLAHVLYIAAGLPLTIASVRVFRAN